MTTFSEPTSSSTTTSVTAATTFKRLHPTTYLSRFLSSSIREDGRLIETFRPVNISLSPISCCNGSAFVKMGNTSCIASVTAEICIPSLSTPSQGSLIPNIELPASCSAKFKPGPPNDEAIVLTDQLYTFLSLFPTHPLLIHKGKAAWCLYLDICFISYDGNPLDVAVLACFAALRNTKLPTAIYNPDLATTICKEIWIPLQQHFPTSALVASFGLFDDYLLSDPNGFESALITSKLSIGIQTSPDTNKLCYVSQSGSLSTSKASDRDNLETCIQLAQKRCQQLQQLLQDAEQAHLASNTPQS